MTQSVGRDRQFNMAAWAKNATAGDEIIYWEGEYCAGPHRVTAYGLSMAGVVILFQRRIAGKGGKFAYYARRAKK